jgi:hypothetical protein
MQFFPIIEPGFITELQPIYTLSPIIAPNFFKPVSILLILIVLWSNLKLDIIVPPPILQLFPKIESPT